MDGLADSFDNFLGPSERASRYRFPESTSGLSNYGQQAVSGYIGDINRMTGMDIALERVREMQTQLGLLERQRKMEYAIQDTNQRKRAMEDGIRAIQSIPSLKPESDEYIEQLAKLTQENPYAVYDPAFSRLIEPFNRRHENFRTERKGLALQSFKDMVSNMSGEELAVFPEFQNIGPQSKTEDIIEAATAFKMYRTKKNVDNTLREFGYEPKDFGDDLAAKAQRTGELVTRREYLDKELKDTRQQLDLLNKSIELSVEKLPDERQSEFGKMLMNKLVTLSTELNNLKAQKTIDGKLKQGQTPQTPQVSANAAQMARQYLQAIISAPLDAQVATPVGGTQKATKAAKEAAQKRLDQLPQG